MHKKVFASWVSLTMVLSFIVIIIEIAPVVEAPTTWYVDDVPGSGGPGDPPEDFTSIQDAINASIDGDTVFVYNGTYYENVVINKTINLTGEDRDNTTIDGGGSGDAVDFDVNYVNITGFSLTGGGDYGVDIHSIHFCSIINNNIYTNNRDGISISSSSNNQIINNRIESNGGYGIDIWSSEYNQVLNNDVYLNDYAGVYLSSSSYNNVTGNTIFSNNIAGIFLWRDSIENMIDYNTIYSNECGIALREVSSNNITENNISSNIGDGISFLDATYNKITNNNITSNTGKGIDFRSQSDYNLIRENRITLNNDKGIYFYASPRYNIITGNEVWNNSYDGIHFSSSADRNIIENNTVWDHRDGGVHIYASSKNILSGNNFSYNGMGIWSFKSSSNDYMNNSFFSNGHGIFINNNPSNDNTISNNSFIANIASGIFIDSDNFNNVIFHNKFIGNSIHADDKTNNGNLWDNGYPLGGNYWSDYGGIDNFKGPNQDIPGSDGIGDTNYSIDSDSVDNYPLMQPYIPLENYTILREGWNLISIPLIQVNKNLTKVLEMIDGWYDAVQWYDITDPNDPWKHHKVGKPLGNDLFELNETMGFWVHITQPGDTIFLYNGTQPTQNQSITLYPGWNLVGYPSLSNKIRTTALNNINFGSDVDSIWTYDAATQKWREIGEFDYFELGRGYWIHSKVTKVWDVPI